jgi:hypothetical protein
MPKKHHDPFPANTNGEPIDPELQAAHDAMVAPGPPPDLEREMAHIVALNRDVRRLEDKLTAAKERAKEAKEAWEVASKELQDQITELGREYPLFERRTQ